MDPWLKALPPAPEAVDERLLTRAAEPGRMRGIAVETLERAEAAPHAASSHLRRALRGARALHSNERRFVADTLYDLIRYQPLLDTVLGTNTWAGRWIAWLDHLENSTLAAGRVRPHLKPLEPVRQVAILAGIPESAAQTLLRTWGEAVFDLIGASNRRPPSVIRVNRTKTSAEALKDRLAADGIETEAVPGAPDALQVLGRANLVGHTTFRDGWFELQDAGSQRIASLVDARGEDVLDLCAGAGGKTLAIARQRPRRLLAADIRPKALGQLRRRARRAGIEDLGTIELSDDGPIPDRLARQRFGRVLVDAPCSGSGVWRRHPEYRWRLSDDTIEQQPELQLQLLGRAASLVDEGGKLVYATCSVLDVENREVVSAFLEVQPGFTLESELTLAPHTDDTDGYYGAVLARV